MEDETDGDDRVVLDTEGNKKDVMVVYESFDIIESKLSGKVKGYGGGLRLSKEQFNEDHRTWDEGQLGGTLLATQYQAANAKPYVSHEVRQAQQKLNNDKRKAAAEKIKARMKALREVYGSADCRLLFVCERCGDKLQSAEKLLKHEARGKCIDRKAVYKNNSETRNVKVMIPRELKRKLEKEETVKQNLSYYHVSLKPWLKKSDIGIELMLDNIDQKVKVESVSGAALLCGRVKEGFELMSVNGKEALDVDCLNDLPFRMNQTVELKFRRCTPPIDAHGCSRNSFKKHPQYKFSDSQSLWLKDAFEKNPGIDVSTLFSSMKTQNRRVLRSDGTPFWVDFNRCKKLISKERKKMKKSKEIVDEDEEE
jgi:hypothetical protein